MSPSVREEKDDEKKTCGLRPCGFVFEQVGSFGVFVRVAGSPDHQDDIWTVYARRSAGKIEEKSDFLTSLGEHRL